MHKHMPHPVIGKIKKAIANPADYPTFCVVEGVRASSLFVRSKYYKLYQWFLNDRMYNSLPFFVDTTYATLIDDHIIKTLSRVTTPSGLIGVFTRCDAKLSFCKYSTFVLCNISDPGNMGTIIRTAVALGRKSIILIDGCHPHNSKVIQATAGALAQIEVIKTTWDLFMKHRNTSYPLYALSATGIPIQSLEQHELESCYWMVGNEAHGISAELIACSDRCVAIPMSKRCESLNAAIAASLVGYRSWSNL